MPQIDNPDVNTTNEPLENPQVIAQELYKKISSYIKRERELLSYCIGFLRPFMPQTKTVN